MYCDSRSKKDRAWTRLYRQLENSPGKAPEIAALALYLLLLGVVSAFHEPWFDEAQAWQIAKCAPMREILFSIPHFEGHPPLWHLLLSLPAKLGAPYEWSIKSINILICSLAAGVLLFRAPFPRIVRIFVPFTYFLFYQYGAIARPYSILFLAFVLAAAAYPVKDIKPFRYIAALFLLCLSSAYGIVFAAGLAFVWLVQICRERGIRGLFPQFLHDRRLWALASLLLFALANIILILPGREAYALALQHVRNGFFLRLVYTLIILPADACFFDCFSTDARLRMVRFDPVIYIAGVLAGLLFWGVLLLLSRRKKTTLLLALPYSVYAAFCSVVYFSQHHIGSASLFLLFWFWVDAGIREDAPVGSTANAGVSIKPRFAEFTHAVRVFCAVVILSVSVFWSLTASCHEIASTYGFGREAAAFLKANRLENRAILCSWGGSEDPVTGQVSIDTNYSGGVTILPYFDHNILININGGSDSLAYITHRKADDKTNRENFQLWKSRGAPDVLLGLVNLDAVFHGAVSMRDYTAAITLQSGTIWKTNVFSGDYSIFLRQSGS